MSAPSVFTHLAKSATGVALGLALSSTTHAGPLTFDYSITNTSYRVTGSETARDLRDAHDAGRLVCEGSLNGFVSIGPRQNCGVRQRNYSLLLSTQFDLADGGNFRFQAGVDWGRGGGVILTNLGSGEALLTDLSSDDLWWGRRWNNRDVFISEFDLDPGAYSLSWIGFEGCCAGETTVRYSFNGGDFTNFTADNFGALVAVPEADSVALLGIGIAGLVLLRRRRSESDAMETANIAAPTQSRSATISTGAAFAPVTDFALPSFLYIHSLTPTTR